MLNIKDIENIDNKIGFFRFKKLGDSFLITNDVGSYSFLNINQFTDFLSGKIISGEKYDELLSKNFIKTDSYKDSMIKSYAKNNNFLLSGPSTHSIFVNSSSNSKSKYNFSSLLSGNLDDNMNFETAKKVVDTIFFTSSKKITIEFQGGEPLMNWDVLKYIIEYSENKSIYLSKDLSINLYSNLILMDEDKFNYILDHNINIFVNLFEDDFSHINKIILDEKKSFWIKKFISNYESNKLNNEISLVFNFTKNTFSFYKDLINVSLENKISNIYLKPILNNGFESINFDELKYSNQDLINFYINFIDYIIESNKKGFVIKEYLSSFYISNILKNTDSNYSFENNGYSLIGKFGYNYDGKIYAGFDGVSFGRIGDNNFLIGEVLDSGELSYKNMINSEVTKLIVQSSTLDGLPGYNESVYKPYMSLEPLNSYRFTGNIISNYSKDNKRKLEYSILDYLFCKLRKKEYIDIFSKWLNIKK